MGLVTGEVHVTCYVLRCREPSVPDGGSEHLSQSESTTPESTSAQGMSKMRVTGVQNEGNRCPKWGGQLTIDN